MLKIANFIFNRDDIDTMKATSIDDDVYVDEEGKHIIFRTIRGQIVPIRASAQDYAEWLQKQGIDVDPADQKTLRQIEHQMDILDEARRIGGPELQQQYQNAFQKNLEEYGKVVQQYYQQALQQQAEKRDTEPEKVHEQKKQIYQKNKDKEVSRSEMEDRGWGSYVESYTDSLIKDLGVDKTKSAWFQFKAFDLILMKALDEVKSGTHPSNIDIENLIKEELSQRSPGFEKYYKDRYAPLADEVVNEYAMPIQMYSGLKKLKEYFDSGHRAASFFRDSFDIVSRKMYDDFHKKEHETFEDIPHEQFDTLGKKITGIPEELPGEIGSREAASVYNIYKKWKGSRISASHRVALHAMGRLYNSIPSSDTAEVVLKLSDKDSGIHEVHKQAYRDMYSRYTQQKRDINVDNEVEEILRIASRVSKGNTSDKVNAMKDIAERLGRIDGAAVLKSGDVKNPQAYSMKWNNIAVIAGRQKGDGPNLIQTLINEDTRNKLIYPNSVLKVPHQPKVEETVSTTTDATKPPEKVKTPGFEDLPEKPTVTEEEPERELKEGEVYPGFRAEGNKVLTNDGFVITADSGLWDIKSPEGNRVARIKLKPHPRDKIEEAKEMYFGMASSLIDEYRRKTPAEYNKDEEGKTRIPVFNFNPDLSTTDVENLSKITDYIHEAGIEVSQKIPGLVYRMKTDDNYIDVVYDKKKSKLVLSYSSPKSGVMFEDLSLEKVQSTFNKPVEEDSGTIENNPPPENLEIESKVLSFSDDELKKLINEFGTENVYWEKTNSGYDVTIPSTMYESWTKKMITQKNVVSSFRR